MLTTELNQREEEILKFIKYSIQTNGYPPSVREIGLAVGLKSSSTAHNYLCRLEKKGYLRRDPEKPRAMEVLKHEGSQNKETVMVPVLGRVAAGDPLLAVENYEDFFPLPTSFIKGDGEYFMLRVTGDSMIEAGILENDLVLVKRQSNADNGSIVVALIDEEATLKRFYRERDYIRLQPENCRLSPILVQNVMILGVAVGLVREF